jgi:hypothetical protein
MNDYTNQAITWYQGTQQVLLGAFESLLNTIAQFLPSLVGALLLLALGYIVAKFLRGLTVKVLQWTGFTKMVENMEFNKHLARVGFQSTISQMIASFVYWIVFITFLIGVFETLGLSVAVRTLESLVAYLPNVIVAAITIVLALVIGRFANRIVDAGLAQFNLGFANIASTVAEAAVVLFGSVIAASQLGLDTTIITANVSIIIAGIMATIVLAVGLGARTVVANILGGYYTKNLYQKGAEVTIAGHTGTVQDISNIGVTLKTSSGNITIPNEVILKRGSLEN